MRFRHFLTCLSLLSLSACTTGCKEYDNNEEFARAQLPAYTETGTNTLGCVLGAQTWTVLGSQQKLGPLGSSWGPNFLQVYQASLVPPLLEVRGTMTGVRNSKPFYDMQVSLSFQLSDTLGGLRLLGADTAGTFSSRFVEQMRASSFVNSDDYRSTARRPVRLLIGKLDRQLRTVSGTFAGMLYSATDSLAVTDGRFDVQY